MLTTNFSEYHPHMLINKQDYICFHNYTDEFHHQVCFSFPVSLLFFKFILVRTPAMIPKLEVPTKYKKEFLERYFTLGKHLTSPVRTCRKKFNFRSIPCRYFPLNTCNRGDQCNFSHDPELFEKHPPLPTSPKSEYIQPSKSFVSPFQ